MQKSLLVLFLALFAAVPFSSAQPTLAYYLPVGVQYSPQAPTPKQYLGYEVGEWHVTHDQLLGYMHALDAASDRIAVAEYGRTHENRPLLLLTVTSPKNHAQIENIKSRHRQLRDPAHSGKLDLKNMPAVVWMGYSVQAMNPAAPMPLC